MEHKDWGKRKMRQRDEEITVRNKRRKCDDDDGTDLQSQII